MSTAVFPGSFDPVTTGHVDLIRRASRMFDRLVVGVLVNSAKQPLFSKEERVAMLREITADQDNIEVSSGRFCEGAACRCDRAGTENAGRF